MLSLLSLNVVFRESIPLEGIEGTGCTCTLIGYFGIVWLLLVYVVSFYNGKNASDRASFLCVVGQEMCKIDTWPP